MEQATAYPGQRLGLPPSGTGSVAGWIPRILALVVDWFACLGVATVVTGGGNWDAGSTDWVTPVTFVAEATLLTALVGGSFGQVVLRLAVIGLDRRPVTILKALVRSLLICLVIPPLVFNRDGRGLHDMAVGTVVVRR